MIRIQIFFISFAVSCASMPPAPAPVAPQARHVPHRHKHSIALCSMTKALPPAWEPFNPPEDTLPIVTTGWHRRGSDGVLILRLTVPAAPDSTEIELKNLDADVGRHGHDPVRRFPDRSTVQWTGQGRRNFACGQTFTEGKNVPMAVLITGVWSADYDSTLAPEADAFCQTISSRILAARTPASRH